jgi:hypothetical protein
MSKTTPFSLGIVFVVVVVLLLLVIFVVMAERKAGKNINRTKDNS